MEWEGEPGDSADNNPPSQPGAESHSSPGPTQGQKRWESEDEAKEEAPQPEDEESTSGVSESRVSLQ